MGSTKLSKGVSKGNQYRVVHSNFSILELSCTGLGDSRATMRRAGQRTSLEVDGLPARGTEPGTERLDASERDGPLFNGHISIRAN